MTKLDPCAQTLKAKTVDYPAGADDERSRMSRFDPETRPYRTRNQDMVN